MKAHSLAIIKNNKSNQIKSIAFIVIASLFSIQIYRENQKDLERPERFLSGEFAERMLENNESCGDGDSLRFEYQLTPPFSSEIAKISVRIDGKGESHGVISIEKDHCSIETKDDTVSEVGVKMDSVPLGRFQSVRNLINNFKQDSTDFMILDGLDRQIQLCDLRTKKETRITLVPAGDSPNSLKLNAELNYLILNAIPNSQNIGAFIQSVARD